jgi:ribosomal 30S subunit maturation factor RimM
LSISINKLEESTFEAGRFVRVHGVQGRLQLRLNRPISSLEEFPEFIFIRIDGGLVPFRVAEESVFQKDDLHLVVGLDDLDTQGKAQGVLDLTCHLDGDWNDWFEMPDEERSTLIGFAVTNLLDGTGGVVTGLEEIPGNPLLEIEIGGKLVLVPYQSEYVVENDPVNKRLTLKIPEDLLNLQG